MNKLTPLQTAALSLLGTLLADTMYLDLLPIPHPVTAHLARLMLALTPFLLGVTLYIVFLMQLSKGVKQNRWPDEQLAPLRRITSSPFFTAFGLLCLAGYFVAILGSRHDRSIGWSTWLLGMSVIQIKTALTPRPTPGSPTLIDWRSRPPLRSDHWGQP